VELVLSRSTLTRCGSGYFGWHEYLYQIQAWSQSLLLPPYVRIHGAEVPLPVFMDSRPVPESNWEYEVAWRDLCRLQPLREVVQQLWWEGLTGVNLL
jgi:hypothetical protein